MCRLVTSVSSDTAWQPVPSVADIAFEIVRGECSMVKQCFAELQDLAALEVDGGGLCVLERGC